MEELQLERDMLVFPERRDSCETITTQTASYTGILFP